MVPTTVSGSSVNYSPNKDFNGQDTVTYRVCTKSCNNACDTANIYIDVCPINDPPVAVDDIDTVCLAKNIIRVLDNDKDVDGDQLKVEAIPCPPKFGTATINEDNTITYVQGEGASTQTPDTFCYVVCDNGNPILCDTATVIVAICRYVGAMNDTQYICKNDVINISVAKNDTVSAGNRLIVTDITNAVPSALGEIINVTEDIITFSANDLTGTVRFKYTTCDDGVPAFCDQGSVIIYIQDCPIPILDTIIDTTYVNTPLTICLEGLINSVKPWSITDICEPLHGTVDNLETCFTYTPDSSFVGNDTFCLTVCNIHGCTTTTVIISVLDTVRCFIPNAFSPNGDEVNDVFKIPCNDDYPKAELRVFNRWGLEVWSSQGPYRNDWDGHNKQGTLLPDGTYYLIYEYNDGTGKRESKYVVIHR
ncbi:MAG: gliding motility-associated C-terminal domain-containing protein [Bacteroidetes bacterium]|nr:gliding motility-associated C-terminal domain-containing protein [Bacteroidota bacterium]